MSHLLAFRCFSTRNKGNNRFCNILLNIFCSTFFSIATYFSNDSNTVCFRIVLEHFEQFLEIETNNWVATNTDSR